MKQLRFRVMPCRLWLHSDPVLLDRIVRNLVANAVNYTESGGIVLGCRRRGSHARIEVWDTGPGIPRHIQQDIFQEFFQIDNPERDRSKGMGLGLAIVDRIARLLDHRVALSSVPGRGSVFSVEVPRTSTSSETIVADPPDNLISPDLTGYFVAVVDDDIAVLEGMQKLCEGWGCQVLACTTEDEMIDILRRQERQPDAIVADYRLAGESNGVHVIDRINAEYGKSIPGIIISGDTAADSLRHAETSGYHLLHKPLRPATLRSLLSFLIRGRSKSVQAHNQGNES